METSSFPPPKGPSAPPPPDQRVPLLAESPVAGVSAAQWNAARQQAAAFHAAQQQAAEFYAARRQMAQWSVPSLAHAPSQGPSRSHRRRAGFIAGVVIVGMIAAATAMVVVGDDEAEAYSLDAATMQAQQTNTVSLEYEASMPDGMTTHADVEMDIDRGLTSMTMDDGFAGEWEYILDLDRNRMYVDADSFEDVGLEVGDAEWVEYELEELIDADVTMYAQFGANPLDVSGMFESADVVEDLGFDLVRGERVKHYEVTIDEEDLGFGAELSTNGFVNDGEGDPEGKIVFDVYVNQSNQMVRLAYSMELMGEYVSFDVTVTGINEPVDIEVPDRADVIGMDELDF